MTAKNETRQRDDQERLDHPIDPLIVAAYRSMMPNWTIDSTRPVLRSARKTRPASRAPRSTVKPISIN